MCAYKIWTDEEVSKLINYVSEYGRTKGLSKFSNETGRSIDSSRRKLLRIDEALKSTDETVTIGGIRTVETDEILPKEKPFEKYEDKPKSLLRRFRDWILLR